MHRREPPFIYTRALLSVVPAPDLDHRLDFAGLMEDKASDPSAWPPPFRVDAEHRPELVDVGGGHFVQAAAQHLEAAQ